MVFLWFSYVDQRLIPESPGILVGDGPHRRDGRPFGAHLVAIDEAGATDRQLHGALVELHGWKKHRDSEMAGKTTYKAIVNDLNMEILGKMNIIPIRWGCCYPILHCHVWLPEGQLWNGECGQTKSTHQSVSDFWRRPPSILSIHRVGEVFVTSVALLFGWWERVSCHAHPPWFETPVNKLLEVLRT